MNFIPLSLVQQIEVLPISASALYSGNPVGGVINIVLRSGLRPEAPVEARMTEVTTTYTNALRRFDAPQSSISLLHSQTLLGGRLRLRLSASLTRTMPPTEARAAAISGPTSSRPRHSGNPIYGRRPTSAAPISRRSSGRARRR